MSLGRTWDSLSWIQTPGTWGTALSPLGLSGPRRCRRPTSWLSAGSAPYCSTHRNTALTGSQNNGMATVEHAHHTPRFKLPQRGVIWDPRVGRVRGCEERVVFQVLLRVPQQTVVFTKTPVKILPQGAGMHTITPTLQSQQNFREEEDKKRGILSRVFAEFMWRT